jgi:RNA polymerase-binding transcription factor DksA
MKDIKKFEVKLEQELKLVEKELKEIAIRSPKDPNGWVPSITKETDMGSDSADSNEVADEIESFGENTAIVSKLEAQYNDIKIALDKIKNETYGKCEVGGEDIPEDRLEANPSARTCMEHSKQ